MLSAHAQHPNCAYKWMEWVSTPKVQAAAGDLVRRDAGQHARPARSWTSCQPGSCAQYHANAPAAYFNSIKFWKTPTADCGNGDNDCTDYNEWQQKWTEVKG